MHLVGCIDTWTTHFANQSKHHYTHYHHYTDTPHQSHHIHKTLIEIHLEIGIRKYILLSPGQMQILRKKMQKWRALKLL
jgi:hypothetical protein